MKSSRSGHRAWRTLPALARNWTRRKGDPAHVNKRDSNQIVDHPSSSLREIARPFWFRTTAAFGLTPKPVTANIERFDRELAEILASSASDEAMWTEEKANEILSQVDPSDPTTFELSGHLPGAFRQRERLAQIAEMCAQRQPGDFLEIGAYVGKTTRKLAHVAQQYKRRVLVIDPWQPGTQNCRGMEYDGFLKNISPYRDLVDIVRASSLDPGAIATIKQRQLCFSLVDGLHTYEACLTDILSAGHTAGLIAVDDLSWKSELHYAFLRGAKLTRRVPVHNLSCREGYLVPRTHRSRVKR